MSPQKKRKTVVKSKAKAVAKNVNKISINIGNKSSKRKSAPKKATVVQNMPVHTSPTIYNPAPTPFYVSQPQPKPYSTFQETISQAKREDKEIIANEIQPRVIPTLLSSSPPSGSFVSSPALSEFSNLETPDNFSQLRTPPTILELSSPSSQRPPIRQPPSNTEIAKQEARRTIDTMNERYGFNIRYSKRDSLTALQAKIQEQLAQIQREPLKKDPFV